MKAAVQTIEIMRSTLQTGLLSGAVESAAAHYDRLCSEAESRLDMISAMLEKGSDYQALQTAEQEPPLLDLVGVLSFGGEKAWMDFCQAHQLPIAPRLDAKTVQALDRLYAQGVTANHPLYKDFRAAVLSREEDKALRIVRTILRLNPADENARSEFQRLENKQHQDILEQLRAALKTDNEEQIATLAEKLTHTAPEEKLQRLPDYQRGIAICRALRRRQAEQKIPQLLHEAAPFHAAGDWRSVALTLEIIDELVEMHGIEHNSSALKSELESLTTYVRTERLAAEKRRVFERILASLLNFADEADTQLLTGAGLTQRQIAALDEGFVRRWRELESLQMPVPDENLERLRRTGQSIRTRQEQMQSSLRTRSLLSLAAVIVFMLGVIAIAAHGWQARSYALELGSYRVRQLCEPAEKLCANLRADEPRLMRWPFLKSSVDETEVWAGQARTLSTQADQALTLLEADASGGFKGILPADILKRLDDAHTLLSQLPGDLAALANNRLTAIKSKSALMLSNLNQERSDSGRQVLEEVSRLLEQNLRYELPAEQVARAVLQGETMLSSLEGWMKPEASALQLSGDLEARVKAARLRVNGFKSELARLTKVREETAAAVTLSEYKKTLIAWQDIRFAEAAAAAPALHSIPTEEQLLADLLTGGDLTVWKAIVEDVPGSRLMPETPLDTDLKILLSLRDDSYLNGVWENSVIDHSRGQTQRNVWSQGPMEASSVSDTQKRWSGQCYDPHPEDTGAAYVKADFKRITLSGGSPQGQAVASAKLSKTSLFMDSLQLDRMTDANGERYLSNVLVIFDKIMADTTAPALVKAYVILEIERLSRARPFAWGLHLSPTFRADLAELQKIILEYPLRSEDWMLPKVHASLGQPLSRFFESHQGRQYAKEALARRELMREVATANVRFGGYLETDLSLHLNNSARAVKEVWVLGKSGPRVSASNVILAPPDSQPLSPAFFIPTDRSALIQHYRQALSSHSQTSNGEPETLFFQSR